MWSLGEGESGEADLQRGEVDDIVDVRVLLEDLVECGFILDVELVELWPFAGDELDAIDDFLGRVVEVVDDDNFVAGIKERERCERANVAGATATG